MSVYFQVSTLYAFKKGKAKIAKNSFFTTSRYSPFLVVSEISPLLNSRTFRTVQEAENYIDYLFSNYPESSAQFPALDADQPSLF